PVATARVDEAPGQATVPRLEYEDGDPADRDVDDPDSDEDGDDGADGDLVAAGTDGATDVGTRRSLADLDEEELSWHRVWFEERPRLPEAAPAPVQVTGLGEGPDLARRRARAWQLMSRLDAALAAGREPSNAVALAALLVPFMPEDAARQNEQAAIYDLSQPLVSQLHVTRRDSERLRYLLTAQRRILQAQRRGAKPELFGGREFVEDAQELAVLLGAGPLVKAGAARSLEGQSAPVAQVEEGAEAAEGSTDGLTNGLANGLADGLADGLANGLANGEESSAEGEESEDSQTDESDESGEPRKRRRRRRGGRRHRSSRPASRSWRGA
ncbi:MAG TPA: hypothetical protein PKU97_05710, partial [Kofleriaceae bacterium]|nr:hypothetical protein [Kofleriaceae bacterium]